MEEKLNVAIACGGTGGHLFPGIAIAQELKRRGHSPYLLISEKKVDQEASAKYEGLDFIVMPAIAKPKIFSLKMPIFILRLWKAISRSQKLLKQYKVDVVIGMGGFTSFAPIYAGKKLRLRTYVHDSNAVPGKSNLMTARYCTKVLLGLEPASRFFPKGKAELVGTPVREELLELSSREEGAAKWGLSPGKPIVFVFGGSQGAEALNTAVLEAAQILQGDVQFLHVTGRRDFERLQGEASRLEGYCIVAFCDEMKEAYAASDIVLCRSGASSLAEIAYLGLPSYLVPYPYAADDHQTANGEVFVKAEAAIMKKQSELSGESLALDLRRLFDNPEELAILRENSKRLAIGEATVRIADVIDGGGC